MVVVLMITALVGALIMQGFLYFAGLQGASERQSARLQQQSQLRSWLQDSARSLVNGADGRWSELSPFQGAADGFSAIAYVGLTYAGGVARPTGVQWQLAGEKDGVTLRYRETPLDSERNSEWYRLRHWPGASARFQYKVDEEWRQEFSANSLVNQSEGDLVLPYGIRLTVDALRGREVITVAVPVHPLAYRPPGVEP